MNRGKHRLKILCCVWIMLLVLIFPSISMAAEVGVEADAGTELATIEPVSKSDYKVIVGETNSLSFRVYDANGDDYSGQVTAKIYDDSDEVIYKLVTNVSQGLITLSNVTFDEVDVYELEVSDGTGSDTWGIYANDADVSTIKSVSVYVKSTITAVLTKNDDDPMPRKQLTIDGTAVGVTSSISCTTLYDGTFSFTITPTQIGTVYIYYQGHEVGSFSVIPAYTTESRIGGQSGSNIALSVAVAEDGWTSAEAVILTREDVLADAMVAVPLSKKLDAPILMTQTGSVDGMIMDEIDSLGAHTAYIIGGTGAVSVEAEQQLRAAGLTVVRFNGGDRYETAALIGRMFGAADTVYLAYGYGEPDALSAGPYAAEQGVPVLLTDRNQLTETTQSTLAALNPVNIVLLGGTGVISQSLEDQLSSQYNVERWGGVDRYGTEQVVLLNALYGKQAPVYFASAYVTSDDLATGKPYGDALLAAALAAKNNGYLVTLPPNNLPQAVNYLLLYNKGYISSGTVVGNTNAISVRLEQQIKTLLDH